MFWAAAWRMTWPPAVSDSFNRRSRTTAGNSPSRRSSVSRPSTWILAESSGMTACLQNRRDPRPRGALGRGGILFWRDRGGFGLQRVEGHPLGQLVTGDPAQKLADRHALPLREAGVVEPFWP